MGGGHHQHVLRISCCFFRYASISIYCFWGDLPLLDRRIGESAAILHITASNYCEVVWLALESVESIVTRRLGVGDVDDTACNAGACPRHGRARRWPGIALGANGSRSSDNGSAIFTWTPARLICYSYYIPMTQLSSAVLVPRADFVLVNTLGLSK